MTDNSPQRVAVVTGASSGIGLETAKALVRLGWHVIGQGRNPERSAKAEADIRKECANGGKLDFVRANMSLMSETKRMADEIKGLTGRIDVLINNAGGVRDKKYVTGEGMEETFSANHFAPFLLTRELMPLLEATAAQSAPGSVRVIAVSSLAYLQPTGGLNWGDIQHLEGDFAASGVYCEAKLANQLFSIELDRRIGGKGIVSQALVPGIVHTNFSSHGDENMQSYCDAAPGLTPEEVAETLVWMATAPETGAPGGRMFYDMQEQPVQPHGKDMAAAGKLWAETEKTLAKIGY